MDVAQKIPVSEAGAGPVSVRLWLRLSVTPAFALVTSLIRAYKIVGIL